MDEMNVPNPIAADVVDNSQQSNTNGVPGSLPGETRAETQARLYKVMVDGDEMEVDEEELKRGYAHNKAASKRMEEASMTRKEAAQVMRMFQENPKEALKYLGKDVRQFAEQIINEELEEAMMDPKDKELRDYKRRVDEYERESRLAKEAYDKEQMEAELNRQAQSIQAEITSTLESSGLPKTERTISRMVYYMQSALAAGYNVTPSDVIDQVKQDYIYDFKSMIGGLSEDQIEMFLGQDLVRKVAKSTVKAEKRPTTVARSVNENVKPKDATKKVLAPKDFFNRGF